MAQSRHNRGMQLALMLGVAFVVVTIWVEVAGSMPGDEWIMTELHAALGTSIDDAMVALGRATDSIVFVVVGLVVTALLVRARRRRDALYFFFGVGVVLAVNPVFKELFERPRPAVRPSPTTVSSFAYPSGHAAGSLALAGAAILIAHTRTGRNWLIVMGAAFVVAVAFSRLAIGVHYPSDIAGGWLWAGAWIALLSAVRAADRPGTTDDVSSQGQ